MAEQVITDLARKPDRQLKKFFNGAGTAIDKTSGTKAIGITAPASLGGIEVAMGKVGADGILTFQSDASGETFTVYVYNELLKKTVAATKGWALGAAAASESSKAVDQYSIATFKLPPFSPWFMKVGTTPAAVLLVSGPEHESNANTDQTNNN